MDQLNIFSGQEPGGPATEEFFQILEEHRKLCERESRFQEADNTRKRLKGGQRFITELRKHEDQRQREHLNHRMKAELLALDNAHKTELKEFNNKWENIIMPNFESETELLQLELRRKHHQELEEFKESLEKDLSLKYHVNSEILELRKKLDTLGQMGKYVEAKNLKKKVKGLEKEHQLKFNGEKKQKIDQKSHKLIAQHHKEITAMQNKVLSQKENLIMQRNKELDIIVKRYHNVKKDIEGKYKMNKIKQAMASPVRRMIVREQVHKK